MAGAPPKSTDAECVKPVPEMVAVVPPVVGPLLGRTLLIASCELILLELGFLATEVMLHARMTRTVNKRWRGLPEFGP